MGRLILSAARMGPVTIAQRIIAKVARRAGMLAGRMILVSYSAHLMIQIALRVVHVATLMTVLRDVRPMNFIVLKAVALPAAPKLLQAELAN